MKSIYDEAIETFHDMHPEYDTANGGTHILHDKVLNALKRAKKEHELLELYKALHNTYRYPTWNLEEEVKYVLEQIKALEEEMK